MYRKLSNQSPETGMSKLTSSSDPIIVLAPLLGGGSGDLDWFSQVFIENHQVIQLYDKRLNQITDTAQQDGKSHEASISFDNYPSIEKISEDFFQEISAELIEQRPIICLGFSYGGNIAQEIVRLCRNKGKMAYGVLIDWIPPTILQEQEPLEWSGKIFEAINELARSYISMFSASSQGSHLDHSIVINPLPNEKWKKWNLTRQIRHLAKHLTFSYEGMLPQQILLFEQHVKAILLPNVLAVNNYQCNNNDITPHLTNIYAETTLSSYQAGTLLDANINDRFVVGKATHNGLLTEHKQIVLKMLKDLFEHYVQQSQKELLALTLKQSLTAMGDSDGLEAILGFMEKLCGTSAVQCAARKKLFGDTHVSQPISGTMTTVFPSPISQSQVVTTTEGINFQPFEIAKTQESPQALTSSAS